MTVEPMLSPAEVAERASLSIDAVYRAIRRGELVATKLSNQLRIEPADFEAWKESGRVEAVDDVSPMMRPACPRRPAAADSFRGKLKAVEGGRG